jgi:hypothetical protein
VQFSTLVYYIWDWIILIELFLVFHFVINRKHLCLSLFIPFVNSGFNYSVLIVWWFTVFFEVLSDVFSFFGKSIEYQNGTEYIFYGNLSFLESDGLLEACVHYTIDHFSYIFLSRREFLAWFLLSIWLSFLSMMG